MSFAIKPLEDRIILLPIKADEVTSFGLVIPDTAKEKPQEAEVIALGPGRVDDNGNRIPLDIKVGERVIFSKYGGTELKHDNKTYLLISARDILAIAEHKA